MDADNAEAIDPIDFLRRALQISPEDAAQVREDAAKRGAEDEPATRRRLDEDSDEPEPSEDDPMPEAADLPEGQHGPSVNYGKDNEIVVTAFTQNEAAMRAKAQASARWGPDGFDLEVASVPSKDIRTGEIHFMAVATRASHHRP